MSVDDIARESLVNWSENEADLDKEQDRNSAEVSDTSGAKLSTIPENEDTDESRATVERNKSDQNRTSTIHSKTAPEEIGSSSANQDKTTVECDDLNKNAVTAEEIGSGQAKSTDVKGSPFASPSENQQRELCHHKEGFEGQSDSDVQKQLGEEENLGKEDCEYESTKEKSKETEVYDSFSEGSVKGDEVRKDSVQEQSIHNEDHNSEKFNKEGAGDTDTYRNVPARSDQKLKSETSKTGTSKSEDAGDSGASEDVPSKSDQELKSGVAKRETHNHDFCEAPKSEVVVNPLAEVHKVRACSMTCGFFFYQHTDVVLQQYNFKYSALSYCLSSSHPIYLSLPVSSNVCSQTVFYISNT